jgi:hypothetical protein
VFSGGEWREKLITIPSSRDVRFPPYEKTKDNLEIIKETASEILLSSNSIILDSGKRVGLLIKRL